ncbi:MAG TPA: hypothetical protein VGP94_15675, partial [Tepidisphaeraceae bacterium]|nr:hypothetical protein [Tepidisphaeraceae bacterium]
MVEGDAEVKAQVMGLAELTNLLSHPAPGFICVPAGAEKNDRRFVARVRHIAANPASPAAIGLARHRGWPGEREFIEFYSRHNGVLLFAPIIPRRGLPAEVVASDGGIRLFPIEEWWEKSDARIAEFFANGQSNPVLPRAAQHTVAIGEVPLSANLFALVVKGWRRGRIKRLDHDRSPFTSDKLARSFDELLGLICQDPAQLLYRLGCYTRYSDEIGDTQWIPIHYVADVRDLSGGDIRAATDFT